MITLTQVQGFLRECSKDDLSSIIREVNRIQKDKRETAKAQFVVGDRVTSDHHTWWYGPGIIEKINTKKIIVRTNSGRVSTPPTILRHVETTVKIEEK